MALLKDPYSEALNILSSSRISFFSVHKSLNPSSVLFKIRNSKYGNGVPTAKISVGTPFPVVPIGNEPWAYLLGGKQSGAKTVIHRTHKHVGPDV